MPAAAHHIRQRRLPFTPQTDTAVTTGLDFTRQVLAEWHLLAPTTQAPHLADDVLLVVGELLANACEHGHGPQELALQQLPGHLHITVSDHNPAPPVLRHPGPEDFSGRGIPIVERLANWGTDVDGQGKTVWADLPTTCSARPPWPDAT